jgi:hypothetical protein
MERQAIRLRPFIALLVVISNVAACGSTSSPTAPSRTPSLVLQSLTVVVGSSGAGEVVLRREEVATGTVALNGRAPTGGALVGLTVTGAESRVLIVPTIVTIPAGTDSATFPVTVAESGVSSPAEVTLNAAFGNAVQSLLIRLAPLP